MYDSIKVLIIVEAGPHSERGIEALRQILDNHFVGQRHIVANANLLGLFIAVLEPLLPGRKRFAFVGIAVN